MADGEHGQAKFHAMVDGTQEDWMAIAAASAEFGRGLPDRIVAATVEQEVEYPADIEILFDIGRLGGQVSGRRLEERPAFVDARAQDLNEGLLHARPLGVLAPAGFRIAPRQAGA